MTRFLRAALVIARRDYRATVLSRTFIMFILSPLMIFVIVGAVFFISQASDKPKNPPVLAVIAAPADAQAFARNYADLGQALDHQRFDALAVIAPQGNADTQALSLLADPVQPHSAVLIGLPDHPRLIGPGAAIGEMSGGVRLALRTQSPVSPAPPLRETRSDPGASGLADKRTDLAGYACTTLFWLNMMLAVRMLAELVEEKSNKIIEILIAAVPVDAVFIGKLIAMLAVSLSIVTAYGLLIGTAYSLFMPADWRLATPAMGWPAFLALGYAYFIANYLLVGGCYLGLGAQAASPREVQTIAMPATLVQVFIFMLARMALEHQAALMWKIAAVFPLTTALVMYPQSAVATTLWPHLLALAWMALWVVLVVRFAGNRYKRHVLKSGPARARKVT